MEVILRFVSTKEMSWIMGAVWIGYFLEGG